MSDTFEIIPYDYATLNTEIKNKLKTKSEWQNVSDNDQTFQALFSLLEYNETLLLMWLNKTFVDSFPHISSAEEAVYFFVDYIGMDVNEIKSATGQVRFYLTEAHDKDIIIPAQTKISNITGTIIYSTTELKILTAGSLYIDVDVIQGEYKVLNFVSDGTNSQKYYIYENNDRTELLFKVNNVEWEYVSKFFFSTNLDQVYTIKKIKDAMYIMTNDGKFGAKPQVNDDIELTYLTSLGSDGNINTIDVLNTLVSNIYDTEDNIVNVKVTNQSIIVNGTDADTFEQIKNNVSRFFVTNPYITNPKSYREYLLKRSEIIDVNVYAGWEIYDDPKFWTTVFIFTLPKNSENLTTQQKQDLFDYLKLKDVYLAFAQFNDIIYIDNYLDIKIKFKDPKITQTKINNITSQISTIINNYFNYTLSLSTYGKAFKDTEHSVISSQIMNITDIKKVNLDIYSNEKVITLIENGTSYLNSLKYSQIKLEGTSLYLNNEKIGDFNSSWELVPLDNSGTGGTNWIGKITSLINYTSKYIDVLLIDPTLTQSSNPNNIIGDIMYVRSEALNGEDIILDGSNMIFKLYDKDISII